MAHRVLGGVDNNSQRLVNVASPSAGTDAANKDYADNLIRGISDLKDPVRVATTAAITLSGTQTIDGIGVVAGDRVLVKNQTAGADNGIYVVAAGAWTRATDADSSADVTRGASTTVLEGTNKGTSGAVANPLTYVLTTPDPITLGTTALTFAPIGGSGGGTTYTAGNGLTETPAGTFNVGAGTGIAVTADAVAIDVNTVARKISADVGGAASVAIAHGLGVADLTVTLREKATGAVVLTDTVIDSANVTFTFPSAPAAGAFRCTIVG